MSLLNDQGISKGQGFDIVEKEGYYFENKCHLYKEFIWIEHFVDDFFIFTSVHLTRP